MRVDFALRSSEIFPDMIALFELGLCSYCIYMEYEPIFTFVNMRLILFKMGPCASFDFPGAPPLLVVAAPRAVSGHLFFREGRRGRDSVPPPQRVELSSGKAYRDAPSPPLSNSFHEYGAALLVVAAPRAVSGHPFFREGRRARDSVPAPQRVELSSGKSYRDAPSPPLSNSLSAGNRIEMRLPPPVSSTSSGGNRIEMHRPPL